MRNFIYGLLVGITLAWFITIANAQTVDQWGAGNYGVPSYGSTTTYTNQYGQVIGSASTYGNTTYYTGPYGQPLGQANTYPYNYNQPRNVQPNYSPYVGGTKK